MNSKRKISISAFYSVVFLLCFNQAFPSIFTTINEGNFNNPFVWQNGQIPSTSANDTIIINNCVNFTSDIFVSGNTCFVINANGFLCGHEDIFVSGSSVFEVFGKINYDTLHATSGHLNFDNNGQHNNGAVIIVGGTATITVNMFNKTNFPYTCPCTNTSIQELNTIPNTFLYPNPTTSLVNIKYPNKISSTTIFNTSGKIIYKSNTNIPSQLNLTQLPSGIFYIKMQLYSGQTLTEKLIINSSH
ncbi:MAG TPA: T9SS type A sorting domain-containing protein [Bacteroidia bacterium]|nr:T9SS type A sorting domain-containing protein [Bacteroidia bacterium]HNU34083.1 T9SS type A sorting domain-containing protein [Bacteroidia bacterium]